MSVRPIVLKIVCLAILGLIDLKLDKDFQVDLLFFILLGIIPEGGEAVIPFDGFCTVTLS
jgi:hypothetical protein